MLMCLCPIPIGTMARSPLVEHMGVGVDRIGSPPRVNARIFRHRLASWQPNLAAFDRKHAGIHRLGECREAAPSV